MSGKLHRQAGLAELEAVDALNEAIRQGDLSGVKQALASGALMNVCTMDSEGFHSPLELALKYGSQEVIDLLSSKTLARGAR